MMSVEVNPGVRCVSLLGLVLSLLPLQVVAEPASLGLLIYRQGDNLRFTDATALTVNGKDKVYLVGQKPVVSGPVNKLSSVNLGDTILREHASNTLLLGGQGGWRYIAPPGSSKDAKPDLNPLWAAAKFGYRPSAAEKKPSELPASSLIAYLPRGGTDLLELCQTDARLVIIGGEAGARRFQSDLIVAAVEAYRSTAVGASLAGYLKAEMSQSAEQFAAGNDSARSLDRGLHFASISEKAFPSDAAQTELRKGLRNSHIWLDRRIAILKALGAASQWDALLLGYGDFEKHEVSFPEMTALHRDALKQSLAAHRNTGNDRLSQRQYRSAFREFRLASMREPSNSMLRKELLMAWTEYSREVAVGRQKQRQQLTVGQRQTIDQALYFASQYKAQNKLDDALKSVVDAEGISPLDLAVLLKKAEILGARNEIVKALETLDQYDMNAVDDERSAANRLRNELLFRLTNTTAEFTSKARTMWSEQKYYGVRGLTQQGLHADNRNPELLYFAGLSSLVTRQPEQARRYLAAFLEVSNTLDADAARRLTASRLIQNPDVTLKAPSDGDKNWLSGRAAPAGIFYCPISLAFSTRVDHIDASNKLTVRYAWDGDRLKSIVPRFEKPNESTGEQPIQFFYDPRIQHVARVTEDEQLPPPAENEDDLLKSLTVMLSNNSLLDPGAVERITGKRTTIGVAGNPYFHPFVWQGVNLFQLRYDSAGRVSEARQIRSPKASPGGEVTLEFEWDGEKLMAIKGYRETGPGSVKVLVYERRQQYQGSQLVGEEIRAGSKSSKIKYTYSGNQLMSADCEKDETLDGRSRQITFLSAAAKNRK